MEVIAIMAVIMAFIILSAILVTIINILPQLTKSNRIIVSCITVAALLLATEKGVTFINTVMQSKSMDMSKTQAPVPASALIVTTGFTSDLNTAIIARRASNGSVAWEYIPQSRTSMAITTENNIIYAIAKSEISGMITIMALREADGHILWSNASTQYTDINPDCEGITLQILRSPIIISNLMFVLIQCRATTAPGALYAIHIPDGKRIWQKTVPVFISSELVSADGILLLSSDLNEGYIRAIYPNSGNTAWTSPLAGPLTINGNLIFVTDKNKIARPLRATDGAYCPYILHTLMPYAVSNTCHPLIQTKQGTGYDQLYNDPNIQSLATSGSTLYAVHYNQGSQYLYAINTSSEEVIWKSSLPSDNESEHIVSVGNNVYVSLGTSLYGIRGSDGKQLWHTQMIHLGYMDLSNQDGIIIADLARIINIIPGPCPSNCEPDSGGLFAINPTNGSIYWYIVLN